MPKAATAVVEAFSLRGAVREAAERGRKAGPDAVAQRVLAQIPAEHLRAALAECLPEFVRQELGRMRMTAATAAARARTAGPSVTREGIQAYARFLHQHVAVGPNQWKHLGECTADDLRAAREDRMAKAVQLKTWADRYDLLAKTLDDSGHGTVADLPEDEVYKIWGS